MKDTLMQWLFTIVHAHLWNQRQNISYTNADLSSLIYEDSHAMGLSGYLEKLGYDNT